MACFSWWNLSVCSVYLVCAALRGCGDDEERGWGALKKRKKRRVCQGRAAVGEPAIWQLPGDDGAASLVWPSLPIGIYLRAVEGIRSSNLGAFANKHVSILSLFIDANKPAKPLAKAFPSWASGSVALYWWGGKKYANTQEIMCFIFLAPVKKRGKKTCLWDTVHENVCVEPWKSHFLKTAERKKKLPAGLKQFCLFPIFSFPRIKLWVPNGDAQLNQAYDCFPRQSKQNSIGRRCRGFKICFPRC